MDFLESVAEKTFKPYEYDIIGKQALDRCRGKQPMRTIVVVGEVGRGKSALTNALVGVRDLSPEGVDFTTVAPVALGVNRGRLPAGSAELFYSDQSTVVNRSSLREWIGRDSQDKHLKGIGQAPTRAFIPLETSALGDAVVIDTPGVGGLNPDHALMAMSTAAQACVLVIACDSSTPITAPEMEFIKNVSSRTDSVIVAVTKIDKNFGRWEQIVEEDKRLLRQYTGREIPVLGISSLLATYSDAALTPEEIAQIKELSGIQQLRDEIMARFDVADDIPVIDALRIAAEGLRQLRGDLEQRKLTLTSSKTILPELSDHLENLKSLKQETERWEQYLQRDLTLIRQSSLTELDSMLEGIKTSWIERINKNGMSVLRRDPQYFTALMEKEFQEAVLKTMADFTYRLEREIIRPRFDSEAVLTEIKDSIAASLANSELQTSSVRDKKDGILDPMMLMMGVSGGSAIGGILAGVASFTGIGVIAGAGWIAFNIGFRAMRSGKNNLINWLRETVGTTKMFTSRLLDATVAQARPVIVITYRDYLRNAIATAESQIKEAKAAAQQDAAQRQRRLERLDKNISIVSKQINRAESLIEEVKSEANLRPQLVGAEN